MAIKSINKDKTEALIKEINKSPAFVAPVTPINWIERSAHRGGRIKQSERKHVYVSISVHNKTSDNDTYKTLCFSFRDNMWTKITSTGYIVFGVCRNRLYFNEAADSSVGYKVSRRKSGYTAGTAMKLQPGFEEMFKPFVHKEFLLKYDDFQELYYIEVEKEL